MVKLVRLAITITSGGGGTGRGVTRRPMLDHCFWSSDPLLVISRASMEAGVVEQDHPATKVEAPGAGRGHGLGRCAHALPDRGSAITARAVALAEVGAETPQQRARFGKGQAAT